MLITHETFHRLHDPTEYDMRLIDRVTVKGKTKTVSVFEVFEADASELKHQKLVTKTIFEEQLCCTTLMPTASL